MTRTTPTETDDALDARIGALHERAAHVAQLDRDQVIEALAEAVSCLRDLTVLTDRSSTRSSTETTRQAPAADLSSVRPEARALASASRGRARSGFGPRSVELFDGGP
jgi:hypothetical protein